MIQNKNEKPGKLEDDPLWREVNELVEYMYARLDDFDSVEKWATASKLRHAACNLLDYVGVSAGSSNPYGGKYDWGNVRKYASEVKTVYRFAGRQKFIEFDPAIMVRLDKIIVEIDKRAQQAEEFDEAERKKTEDERQKDLDAWREKHKLWKEMNS
jgi:hypothetical protein